VSTKTQITLDVEQVRALYVDEALTIEEVADKVGCSRSTLRRFLKKNDIPCRRPGGRAGIEPAPVAGPMAPRPQLKPGVTPQLYEAAQAAEAELIRLGVMLPS
jgi:excisionase family DNA binding protein